MAETKEGNAAPAGGHAVVIGGSTTGLLATAALRDHFARVTLVERDRFPDGPESRKGVPQMRHVHVLLKRGEGIMARFLPGLLDELRSGGANCIDMAGDTKWYHFGDWKPRFRSGMEFYCQSRPFLEWKIRSRVAALGGVELRDGTEVIGLRASAGAIRGVSLGRRDDGNREEMLDCDLVVDAGGRGSRTGQWLEAIGYPTPATSTVTVDVGYSSAFFRPPKNATRDWKALFIYPRAPGKRLSVIIPVEGGLWMVTHVGWFRDYPPADPEGFLDFARSLPEPDVWEAIRHAELVSPIATHRFPANLRRHYERLDRFPERLAVLGDALCSFNPIYGQGMTTGALGVETLHESLARQWRARGQGNLAGFADRFRKEVARAIDGVWLQTTCEDFRYPETEGVRPGWAKLMNWYTGRLYELLWTDERISAAFLAVMHLLERPSSLFRPYVLGRVLAHRPRGPRTSRSAAVAGASP